MLCLAFSEPGFLLSLPHIVDMGALSTLYIVVWTFVSRKKTGLFFLVFKTLRKGRLENVMMHFPGKKRYRFFK